VPAEVELFCRASFDRKRQKHYYARLMSGPAVIDSVEFARSAQQLSGSLPAASLKRLEDVLYDSQGCVDYEVRGDQDKRGRLLLRLSITGQLHLQCQRCLNALEHRVRISNTLLLASLVDMSAKELDDPEAPDVIEPQPELDVAALIEDEVLLSLPLAARHPEGTCEHREREKDSQSADAQPAFAKLAALKRPH
jgi:uncharacterized protein